MKLIEDIINELVDADKSISSALLKTKVLAARIENKELLSWVSNEIGGYDNAENLPEYRIHNGVLRGTYIHGNMKCTNNLIPLVDTHEDYRDLKIIRFTTSISSLANLPNIHESGSLDFNIPSYYQFKMQEYIQSKGNQYFNLVSCKSSISVTVVDDVIATVRNKLLDFMLKIESEFGYITEIKELKIKKEEIKTIMNKTIINNTGDGNVVNTGNESNIETSINITKGNIEQLKDNLKNLNIEDSYVNELINIIDVEEPNREQKVFGKEVNQWVGKMISKSLDGSWNISIATAGNLLATAINSFYGI